MGKLVRPTASGYDMLQASWTGFGMIESFPRRTSIGAPHPVTCWAWPVWFTTTTRPLIELPLIMVVVGSSIVAVTPDGVVVVDATVEATVDATVVAGAAGSSLEQATRARQHVAA